MGRKSRHRICIGLISLLLDGSVEELMMGEIMKKLLATASAVIALSTAADASTVAFGFKDSVGVANGATEITWTNGGISLSQTDKQLTVDIYGDC